MTTKFKEWLTKNYPGIEILETPVKERNPILFEILDDGTYESYGARIYVRCESYSLEEGYLRGQFLLYPQPKIGASSFLLPSFSFET